MPRETSRDIDSLNYLDNFDEYLEELDGLMDRCFAIGWGCCLCTLYCIYTVGTISCYHRHTIVMQLGQSISFLHVVIDPKDICRCVIKVMLPVAGLECFSGRLGGESMVARCQSNKSALTISISPTSVV